MSYVSELFKNLLVVECASVLAGPAVGMFFAELGSHVIKIENPKTGGDLTRKWKLPSESRETDVSAYFSSVNWGKQSITLNLYDSSDRKLFDRIISKADIFIQNFKPGDEAKLNLSYSTLKQINEKLIYARIDAFGEDDPRPGFDAILQAETGYMSINGKPGDDPLKMPVALIDVLLAHQVKEAILIALLERSQSGKGSFITSSLFDAGVSSLVNQATNYLVAGVIPIQQGSEHPNIAPYGSTFQTKDKLKIVIAAGTDKQFKTLCEIIELKHLPSDDRFSKNQQRVANRDLLNKLLAEKIALLDSNEILTRLQENSVPCGLVRDLESVFNLKHSKQLLLSDEKTGMKGVKSFIPKLDFNSVRQKLSPPPKPGEHNAVLRLEFDSF